MSQLHTMSFYNLDFDMRIGCFAPERSQTQKIRVDFEASVKPIDAAHRDDPEYIVVDYALVAKELKNYLEGREFRLIETAAEGVLELLFTKFKIESVKVRLTKWPQDMPKGSYVVYEIERNRA